MFLKIGKHSLAIQTDPTLILNTLQKQIAGFWASPNTTFFIRRFVFFLCGLWVLFGTSIEALAQSIPERKTKKVPFTIFETDNEEINIHDLLKSDELFVSVDQMPKRSDPDKIYWVKLDFLNESDTLRTQDTWYLRSGISFSFAKLLYSDEDKLKEKDFGIFDTSKNKTSSLNFLGIDFQPSNLIEGKYLYLKIRPLRRFSEIDTWSFGYLSEGSHKFYTDYYDFNDLQRWFPPYLFSGACTILFLIFLVIYFNTGKLEFLYYALYIMFSSIYLTWSMIPIPGLRNILYSYDGHWLGMISQVFINLFYVLFIAYYLETKRNYPKLHKFILITFTTLVVVIASHAIAYFFLRKHSLHLHILNLQRYFMTAFALFGMVYLLRKTKDRLTLFIVFGSFAYLCGALLLMVSKNRFYMIGGVSLEIIIFSLGLAYKIKKEYEARLKLQEEVSLKEISALRAQMNPHFIFNSLNSIQHLILTDNKKAALQYLTKFGKLTRQVLDNSIEAQVSLSDEIRLLNSYLELESLRFENGFKYKVEVDENLDTDDIEIPLLLVQPFVENAILHGLLPKKDGEKILRVIFKKNEENVICEVDDSGIGRTASQNLNKIANKERKSHGLKISEKRLQLISSETSGENRIEIVDKYDSEGNAAGTKVIIKIQAA
ncbi:hypothetical protein GTQ34_08380 [Muricauda sp. JGD-17]|uniref:7TM diverse intracellular signalling n=1 Tax=Flagellimonas ochracea TaxID=2696472 RepID=A0A964TBQ0_9FLAO|nr:histidine kinase [Allomuricauda ochracea]NAY91932.1 hypothetical protein [Allomuricauda ochracea]